MSEKSTDAAHPVDVHVGAKIRFRRKLVGVSQEHLADALGLTFQQVQKYERGANRVSASKLYEICRALDCPPSYFFDGLDFSPGDHEAGGEVNELMRLVSIAGGLELAQAYRELNPAQRANLLNVAHSIVKLTREAAQGAQHGGDELGQLAA